MTFLAALALAQGPVPATAADFFPLVAGPRRVYEQKSGSTTTLVDEIGGTAYFDGAASVALVRKNPLTDKKETTYYRVDGPTVFIVGYAEDRSHATGTIDNPVEKDQRKQTNVLMALVPAMPVFKYEGAATQWTYTALPKLDGRETDPIAIVGTTKPGAVRTVLGRKVETIEVRAEVKVGMGSYPQKIVETTIYGRGIGMIESTRKATLGKETTEVRTKLIGLEEKTEGH